MSRACADCGIAPGQDCICTDEGAARVEHERAQAEAASIDEHARRVAIQHVIRTAADDLLHGDDTRRHLDEHERLARLTAAAGDTATDILDNSCLDLDAALLRIAAEAQLWLESRAREAAR